MNQQTWNSVDEVHRTGLSYDRYFRTSKWLAATVALIVVLVFVGWTFHINRPTRLSPDHTAMNVTTAIGLLCLAGLLLLNPQIIRPDSSGTRVRNGVAFVLAAMAGLLGLGTLLGYATHEAVRFVVRNSGIGIAPEDQTRIFDEFVQLRHPLQQRISGQGLGLALCKRLADVLGAIITVESQPGKGSTFSIAVPCDQRTSVAMVEGRWQDQEHVIMAESGKLRRAE